VTKIKIYFKGIG